MNKILFNFYNFIFVQADFLLNISYFDFCLLFVIFWKSDQKQSEMKGVFFLFCRVFLVLAFFFFFFLCGKPSSYCYGNKPWLADTELHGQDSHKGNAVFIKQAF